MTDPTPEPQPDQPVEPVEPDRPVDRTALDHLVEPSDNRGDPNYAPLSQHPGDLIDPATP